MLLDARKWALFPDPQILPCLPQKQQTRTNKGRLRCHPVLRPFPPLLPREHCHPRPWVSVDRHQHWLCARWSGGIFRERFSFKRDCTAAVTAVRNFSSLFQIPPHRSLNPARFCNIHARTVFSFCFKEASFLLPTVFSIFCFPETTGFPLQKREMFLEIRAQIGGNSDFTSDGVSLPLRGQNCPRWW